MRAWAPIAVFFLFLVASTAFGNEYRVTGVGGEVTVQREGSKSRRVVRGEVLKEGDTIRTRRDSIVTLRAENGNYRVFPYSLVELKDKPVIVWGKLSSSPDAEFPDIRFYFYPRPTQGRTMKVGLRSQKEALLVTSHIRSDNGYKKEVLFYPQKEGSYRALTGFDVGLLPAKYWLEVRAEDTASTTWIVYPFYLKASRYGSGRVYIEQQKSSLFSPSQKKKKQQEELGRVLSSLSDEARWKGKFGYPVKQPVVISGFGKKRIYYLNHERSMIRYHRGIDFKGEVGDPVFAPGDGVTVFAEERITTGNTLVIDHGQGVFSLFFHLDSISILSGTVVKKGSRVAEIGSTGITEGSHLHWGLLVDGVYVDPNDWVKMKF
jgi:murein DD-endopeptidase MepM/ murein hydrolase activator NlpD